MRCPKLPMVLVITGSRSSVLVQTSQLEIAGGLSGSTA
jgi:hypothetical protein